MKVVIDTNCLLSCISKTSPYRNIFDAFLNEQITFCANAEMFLEYEEMFTQFWNTDVAKNLLALFEVSINFKYVTVYYNWNLVKDADDNKFTDTYVSAAADVLVSQDGAIRKLKSNTFPAFNILSIDEFSDLLKEKF